MISESEPRSPEELATKFLRGVPDHELADMRELFRGEPSTEFEAVRKAIIREIARRRFGATPTTNAAS